MAIPDITSLLLALGVVFLATLIHACVGFGTALVAMPLLTIVLGLATATPLVALVMLTTTTLLFWGTRQHMDIRSAWQLLLSSAGGLPLGLLLVRFAPERGVKALLGIVIIAFSIYNLTRPQLPMLRGGAWAFPFGFAAGLLGGAYNTNGPPVVLYGALRHWPPDRFRATLQGFFLPAALMICAGHALAGLWSPQVFQLYGLSLPAVLLALPLGLRLGRRVPAGLFGRVLYASLIVLGALLLL